MTTVKLVQGMIIMRYYGTAYVQHGFLLAAIGKLKTGYNNFVAIIYQEPKNLALVEKQTLNRPQLELRDGQK